MEYFSDREGGARPATNLEIGSAAWGGCVALVGKYISNGGFGIDFRDDCPDGRGPIGTDSHEFGLAVRGEIPELDWPLQPRTPPRTPVILDFLELCWQHVAEPIEGSYTASSVTPISASSANKDSTNSWRA
jgi:hypothetical protein